jgi:cephalosporin-C deacetylase
MMRPVSFSILKLLLALGVPLAAGARPVLTAMAERAGARYARGELVTFVLGLQEDGKPVTEAELTWTLSKDGVPPLQAGRVRVEAGRAVVTGRLEEPGFLQLRVKLETAAGEVSALAGAAVEPERIGPSLAAPQDFDAFWAEQKRRLAAVPLHPQLTTVKSGVAGVEAADVQLDCVGAPVSGYFAQPAGARVRSLPAILTVHGAGVNSASLATAAGWAREGALAFDINAHGLPNGRGKAFYEQLAAGELKDYRLRGRNSREEMYFLGMFLRVLRALDFLTMQDEWDRRTLVVFGSSQGGAQALAAAGLDPRVSFFVAGVPAMCDHTGGEVQRIAGWPKFIPTGQVAEPPVREAVRYFDGVNFAARARARGFFTVGFIDSTCPPTTVYAAYNALTEPKRIFDDIPTGHANSPAAREAMRAAVLAHFAAQAAVR